HAFPLNGRMFESQMRAFSGSHRVVAPDYPGFGRSPRTPAQPDVHYYAKGVRGLLDRLHLDRVVLGGVSMGGYVAFECMRLFPERVTALVLANTRADPDSEEMREARNETALRVAEEGVGVLVELQMERLLAPDTLKNDEELVENVRAMIFENSPDGVVAALGAMRERPDSTPFLEKIDVPTLVVGGEEDSISSPDIMGDMAAKIPEARHVTIPRTGHLSNLEAPEKFDAVLEDFLQSIG
ncbi:MAG TPA: alpha/beta hydrolase, partial [Rubrobacter sp.]|nr:alpha/beta hydrolase [Rubrobacter sp.]